MAPPTGTEEQIEIEISVWNQIRCTNDTQTFYFFFPTRCLFCLFPGSKKVSRKSGKSSLSFWHDLKCEAEVKKKKSSVSLRQVVSQSPEEQKCNCEDKLSVPSQPGRNCRHRVNINVVLII